MVGDRDVMQHRRLLVAEEDVWHPEPILQERVQFQHLRAPEGREGQALVHPLPAEVERNAEVLKTRRKTSVASQNYWMTPHLENSRGPQSGDTRNIT